MTKSPSKDPEDWGSVNIYQDEWFVLYKDVDWTVWEAEGPFSSRLAAEREADDLSHYDHVRVVHSVFTN